MPTDPHPVSEERREVDDGWNRGNKIAVVEPREFGPKFRWAISMCGGRDRIYGPDTPCGIGEYIEVLTFAEHEEKLRQERERTLDEVRDAVADRQDVGLTVRVAQILDSLPATSKEQS